jgi:DNA replication protein DnaC
MNVSGSSSIGSGFTDKMPGPIGASRMPTLRCDQEGLTAYYARVPRLVNELAIARTDGSYLKLLTRLAKFDLVVLDDWALSPLEGDAMHSLLEVIDDRAGFRSTLITSQLPVGKWHGMVGDPSVADAILDRMLGSAIQINLKGESIRRREPSGV